MGFFLYVTLECIGRPSTTGALDEDCGCTRFSHCSGTTGAQGLPSYVARAKLPEASEKPTASWWGAMGGKP